MAEPGPQFPGPGAGDRTGPQTGEPRTRPSIGAHVPVAGGFAAGLRYAAGIGAEAIQVFVSNPRSWSLPAGEPAQQAREADAIGARLAEAGLPVFVHTPYLINVGSADPVTRDRSVASIRHSLHRGGAIGARGVVVHTGSAAGGDRDKSMLYARESLLPVLDSIPADGPDLLLEPMAGQGHLLCTAVTDLGPYLEMLDWHPRAAVCLDTCHVFSAGHDLAAPGGAAAVMSELAGVLGGTGRLALVHANDSKDPCGSRRDRHENIGAGQIGAPPFGALLRHPAAAGVPFVIETPGPQAAHTADIATLRGLRDR
ncbi:MAG: apurinic endonuclease Apn1 [Actinomycetia bacterium]|nr:apurinic endonuclease Apn1 [Actinomycetes bacterium]